MTKLKVVSNFVCNRCNKPILSHDGYHVMGNILVADPNVGKGYVGDAHWISKIDNGQPFTSADIPESVWCKNCFCNLLGIQQAPLSR